MTDKEKLLEIYKRKEYRNYDEGFKNDGSVESYKNQQIISFIKYFTRLLAYGPKFVNDYMEVSEVEVVFKTEAVLNDEIQNIEKCKNIDDALDNLLDLHSDWFLNWNSRPMFKYVLQQIYSKKSLDKKYWGW